MSSHESRLRLRLRALRMGRFRPYSLIYHSSLLISCTFSQFFTTCEAKLRDVYVLRTGCIALVEHCTGHVATSFYCKNREIRNIYAGLFSDLKPIVRIKIENCSPLLHDICVKSTDQQPHCRQPPTAELPRSRSHSR